MGPQWIIQCCPTKTQKTLILPPAIRTTAPVAPQKRKGPTAAMLRLGRVHLTRVGVGYVHPHRRPEKPIRLLDRGISYQLATTENGEPHHVDAQFEPASGVVAAHQHELVARGLHGGAWVAGALDAAEARGDRGAPRTCDHSERPILEPNRRRNGSIRSVADHYRPEVCIPRPKGKVK